eukprot:TRINITY_DN16620_c0_g1_i1.p1 TRINITY_DN16620_c0_g1~~TRINITY_DN16620_c0_g1_i1.p1  ORF type:complete len:1800 (+),score=115.51 TRINITY_DN16620_c0_g1_i1:75-5474(+)
MAITSLLLLASVLAAVGFTLQSNGQFNGVLGTLGNSGDVGSGTMICQPVQLSQSVTIQKIGVYWKDTGRTLRLALYSGSPASWTSLYSSTDISSFNGMKEYDLMTGTKVTPLYVPYSLTSKLAICVHARYAFNVLSTADFENPSNNTYLWNSLSTGSALPTTLSLPHEEAGLFNFWIRGYLGAVPYNPNATQTVSLTQSTVTPTGSTSFSKSVGSASQSQSDSATAAFSASKSRTLSQSHSVSTTINQHRTTTASQTISQSRTATLSQSSALSKSASVLPLRTNSATRSRSTSISESFSGSATPRQRYSQTVSRSSSGTNTLSCSVSPRFAMTHTSSRSATRSWALAETVTKTFSKSFSRQAIKSLTATKTESNGRSQSNTVTATKSTTRIPVTNSNSLSNTVTASRASASISASTSATKQPSTTNSISVSGSNSASISPTCSGSASRSLPSSSRSSSATPSLTQSCSMTETRPLPAPITATKTASPTATSTSSDSFSSKPTVSHSRGPANSVTFSMTASRVLVTTSSSSSRSFSLFPTLSVSPSKSHTGTPRLTRSSTQLPPKTATKSKSSSAAGTSSHTSVASITTSSSPSSSVSSVARVSETSSRSLSATVSASASFLPATSRTLSRTYSASSFSCSSSLSSSRAPPQTGTNSLSYSSSCSPTLQRTAVATKSRTLTTTENRQTYTASGTLSHSVLRHPSRTQTSSPSFSNPGTQSKSASNSLSFTPGPTTSHSSSGSRTNKRTVTRSSQPTLSATHVLSLSGTASGSFSAQHTLSRSLRNTLSGTGSLSSTFSHVPTPVPTGGPTLSATQTCSVSQTPTETRPPAVEPTKTRSATPSKARTESETVSPTQTHSWVASSSRTRTGSASWSLDISRTQTLRPTLSSTLVPSPTATLRPTTSESYALSRTATHSCSSPGLGTATRPETPSIANLSASIVPTDTATHTDDRRSPTLQDTETISPTLTLTYTPYTKPPPPTPTPTPTITPIPTQVSPLVFISPSSFVSRHNANMRLNLNSYVTRALPFDTASYRWSVDRANITANDTVLGITKPAIFFKPYTFVSATAYSVRIDVLSPEESAAGISAQDPARSARISLPVNLPPKCRNCSSILSVAPSSTTIRALSTTLRLTVNLSNWIDEAGDYPLSYRIAAVVNGTEYPLSLPQTPGFLWTPFVLPTATVLTPAFPDTQDAVLAEFVVYVSDAYGAYDRHHGTSITILQPNSWDNASQASYLETLLNAAGSSGTLQQATFATELSSTLPCDSAQQSRVVRLISGQSVCQSSVSTERELCASLLNTVLQGCAISNSSRDAVLDLVDKLTGLTDTNQLGELSESAAAAAVCSLGKLLRLGSVSLAAVQQRLNAVVLALARTEPEGARVLLKTDCTECGLRLAFHRDSPINFVNYGPVTLANGLELGFPVAVVAEIITEKVVDVLSISYCSNQVQDSPDVNLLSEVIEVNIAAVSGVEHKGTLPIDSLLSPAVVRFPQVSGSPTCVFWNTTSGKWSSDGLTTVTDSVVQCQTTHFTQFAVAAAQTSSLGAAAESLAALRGWRAPVLAVGLFLFCLLLILLVVLCAKKRKRRPVEEQAWKSPMPGAATKGSPPATPPRDLAPATMLVLQAEPDYTTPVKPEKHPEPLNPLKGLRVESSDSPSEGTHQPAATMRRSMCVVEVYDSDAPVPLHEYNPLSVPAHLRRVPVVETQPWEDSAPRSRVLPPEPQISADLPTWVRLASQRAPAPFTQSNLPPEFTQGVHPLWHSFAPPTELPYGADSPFIASSSSLGQSARANPMLAVVATDPDLPYYR